MIMVRSLKFVALMAFSLGWCFGADKGADNHYRFRGGETVRIIVPTTVGESTNQVLQDDCTLSLVNGAMLEVKGKTVAEVQKLAIAALSNESSLKNLQISVVLMDAPPRRLYITGEVKIPQSLIMPPGSEMNLATLFATVGGVLPTADLSRVSISRRSPDGTREQINVDATKLGAANGEVGPTLFADDIVTLPRCDFYYVTGEVARPGPVSRNEVLLNTPGPILATRAIMAAGGLKPGANRKSVHLARLDKNGHEHVLNVNLDSTHTEGSSDDPGLMNGDIIVVGGAGGVMVYGKVKAPGYFPLQTGTSKISQIIALAGGFIEFAKTSSVVVTHAGSRQTVKVDMSAVIKDGAVEKDIEVEDGDIIYVGGGAL